MRCLPRFCYSYRFARHEEPWMQQKPLFCWFVYTPNAFTSFLIGMTKYYNRCRLFSNIKVLLIYAIFTINVEQIPNKEVFRIQDAELIINSAILSLCLLCNISKNAI